MKQNFFHIDEDLKKLDKEVLNLCKPYFEKINEVTEYNQLKVMRAFADQRVSESHFTGTTGYGYDDRGRDTLDSVFAQITGSEDALVRHNFVSGTHALSVGLFGVLRPNDKVVCVTGTPYDTIQGVFGFNDNKQGSLKDFGVEYGQVDLLENGEPNYSEIEEQAKTAKMIYIQRSRGYALRPSLNIDTIEKIIKAVKKGNKEAVIFVDNCYGEFVETREPTEVGADLIVGSLIKNPGGGIARTGGYIAGRKDLVELCAYRLTTPGTGKEIGCTLDHNRSLYMGIFLAPTVTGDATKISVYTSCLYEKLGFSSTPKYQETRTDIIVAVTLNTPEKMVAFCQGVQKGAPVDSFVSQEPWDMPGYDEQIIMAAGAFTMGASIELSADGPMKEPYTAWLQGGLNFFSGKMGVLLSAQSMRVKGLI